MPGTGIYAGQGCQFGWLLLTTLVSKPLVFQMLTPVGFPQALAFFRRLALVLLASSLDPLLFVRT